ncbi:MAG: hypothetical protein ACE5HD_07065 [Acidobacteriota bacterium]
MTGRRVGWILQAAAVAAAAVFHTDLWLWNDSRRVLGLPVGLAYHVGFCAGMGVLMAVLVRHVWPAPAGRRGRPRP